MEELEYHLFLNKELSSNQQLLNYISHGLFNLTSLYMIKEMMLGPISSTIRVTKSPMELMVQLITL